jgi:acetyltransferase-like isoleucine patch superfamily enzyme
MQEAAQLEKDHAFNRDEFARHNVRFAEFPVIHGRIHIAKFADGGVIRIGRRVVINSSYESNPVGGSRTCFLIKGPEAVIEIGDEVGMSNVLIAARERVTIEEGVALGAGCKILDTDFHSLDYAERVADVNIPTRPVTIGARAFIGMEAVILKGVTVGEEAVIGARSVVARSVPAGEIWAGNPARFIRKLGKIS